MVNNYDLTDDMIFSKKKKRKSFTLTLFQKNIEPNYSMTGALPTGNGRRISYILLCDGFGSNNNVCDCCGGKINNPFSPYGLCEKCKISVFSDSCASIFYEKPKDKNNISNWWFANVEDLNVVRTNDTFRSKRKPTLFKRIFRKFILWRDCRHIENLLNKKRLNSIHTDLDFFLQTERD